MKEIRLENSESYPSLLRKIQRAPNQLWVLGDIELLKRPAVAIVGTRTASIYGLEMATHFAKKIASAGITVVSGLARGIDTAAHRGALETGNTIAVIGSGLSHIYPPENHELAKEIAKKGALISEYSPTTAPHKGHFPERNRIVSGMCLAVLMIEAPEKSGAMITMRLAQKQGKKRYVLPARVDQIGFEGNHLLLKSHGATYVNDPDDVIKDLGFATQRLEQSSSKKPEISIDEEKLLEVLPNEELSIEEIAMIANLPVAKLNILLMSLVLKRLIVVYPGRIYRKTQAGHEKQRTKSKNEQR